MATCTAWSAVTLTALVSSSLLWQANEVEAAQQDAASPPAVSFYSSGIDGWLGDGLDAGLREALRRLVIDGPSLPPEVSGEARLALELATPLLLGETSFQLNIVPPSAPGMPPVAIELASKGVRGFSGDSLWHRIQHDVLPVSNLKELGVDPDHAGIMRYQTGGPGPEFWMGSNDGTYLVSFPDPPSAPRDTFADAGLPAGNELLGGFRVNFSALQPFLGMAAESDPGAAAMLQSWGLIGPNAMDFVLAVGGTQDAMYVQGKVTNYGTHFGHLLPAAGVTEADLRRIPRSAVSAQSTRLDLGAYVSTLLQMMTESSGPEAGQQLHMAMGQIRQHLGIDVHADVLAPLGDSFTCYMSDETGGNGFGSMVGLVALKDAETMEKTLRTVQRAIDGAAAKELRGYVRLMTQRIHGCDVALSLRFPGVPIPLEPTIAIAQGQLVCGLFPQSVAAAVAQFNASDSILDAEGFQRAGGTASVGSVQVKYLDQSLRAKQGYGYAALLGAAIDNYTRSRTNAEASAPPVLPPFNKVTGDVRSGLFTARLDGGDLIMSGSADRSMVVQVAAGIGELGALTPLVAAMAAGLLLPAISTARASAQRVHASAQRQREISLHAAGQETKNVGPLSPHRSEASTSPPADRLTRLQTLATAMQMAGGDGTQPQTLRSLVRGGWITNGDLSVPGHPDAYYLLVGGGALHTEDGAPCQIAEPGGLPHGRLCITTEGRIASVGN